MSESEEKRDLLRALFVFFASIPFAVFRFGYFVFTIPRRVRRRKEYERSPKSIDFLRLSDRHESLLSVVALTNELRTHEGDRALRKPPKMYEIVEALWDEEEGIEWKIPTVTEVRAVSEKLLRDIEGLPHREGGVGRSHVWAIDENTQMFVIVDLRKDKEHFATPENMLAIFRGNAPESVERSYGYAVQVRLMEKIAT